MTLIVGTDFSSNSGAAARAAASIARKLRWPLVLMHASGSESPDHPEPRARQLAEEIEREQQWPAESHVRDGDAAELLAETAAERAAELVIVSALSSRETRSWLVGSVAERVTQISPSPVLAIHDAAVIQAWANGERALRVTLGVEPSATSQAALDWVKTLPAIGACELSVVQIAWPPEARHQAAEDTAPLPLDQLDPKVERTLLKQLTAWVGEVPEGTSLQVRPGWGRTDAHLVEFATAHQADLLVVGTHQRAALARIWQGSVSRAVLGRAPMNVACVPMKP